MEAISGLPSTRSTVVLQHMTIQITVDYTVYSILYRKIIILVKTLFSGLTYKGKI
jgi:hypothetical protein